MDEKSLSDMLMEDPEKVFALLDAAGSDYQDLKNLQLGKLFATERFSDLKEKEYDAAADFVFWFSYWVEREIHNDIASIEQKLKRATQVEMEQKLDGMTFGEKIQFLVDKRYITQEDPYIIFLKEARNLRNHLSHGRLSKLEYAGYALSHPKGQLTLLTDLRKALSRRGKASA